MRGRRAMKKILIIMLIMTLSLLPAACADREEAQNADTSEDTLQTEKTDNEEERGATGMKLKINDEEVDVKWEDNDSVRALADLASEGPVTVDTSLYGGFEQAGSLGTDLPNDDVDTTTEPGDIVLYSGNSIVVFFGTNTWAYTRLGHIEGKSVDELRNMLGGNNAVLTITSD